LKGLQSRTLRRHLEEQIAGEVRFDAVSRALYSTHASVYQIHPLGVVIVKWRVGACVAWVPHPPAPT